jgi:hypothetical protein
LFALLGEDNEDNNEDETDENSRYSAASGLFL